MLAAVPVGVEWNVVISSRGDQSMFANEWHPVRSMLASMCVWEESGSGGLICLESISA